MEASAVPRLAPTGASGISSPRIARLTTDAHLVSLVRQGRPQAFETVYSRYHRAILSFCRHMLGDADEAEDVVQHTFLAAYNDLIASEKPIHLRPWLFTIARNRCYSVLRARREQPSAELDETATEGLAVQVQRRQDLRDLVQDVRGLPDDQRAALVLAELDALSHDQIAEVLGVPSKKVKALVFQARESLLASRTARDTACADIREQLANSRGAALRRANLRRHLRECQGCRDFRKQVERQRGALTALLPVVPSIALKEGVIAGTVGVGAATGVATGGIPAGAIFKSAFLKGIIGILLAGGAGTLVVNQVDHSSAPPVARRVGLHRHTAAFSVARANLSGHGVTAPGPRLTPSNGSSANGLLGLAATTSPTGVRDPLTMVPANPSSHAPSARHASGLGAAAGHHLATAHHPLSGRHALSGHAGGTVSASHGRAGSTGSRAGTSHHTGSPGAASHGTNAPALGGLSANPESGSGGAARGGATPSAGSSSPSASAPTSNASAGSGNGGVSSHVSAGGGSGGSGGGGGARGNAGAGSGSSSGSSGLGVGSGGSSAGSGSGSGSGGYSASRGSSAGGNTSASSGGGGNSGGSGGATANSTAPSGGGGGGSSASGSGAGNSGSGSSGSGSYSASRGGGSGGSAGSASAPSSAPANPGASSQGAGSGGGGSRGGGSSAASASSPSPQSGSGAAGGSGGSGGGSR